MQTNNINILQNRFHSLLENFLNGSVFSKKAKILFPLNKSVNLTRLEPIIDEINEILGMNIKPKSNIELAEYISSVYQKLLGLNTETKKDTLNINCKYSYLESNYDTGKKQIVNKLVQSLISNNFFDYIDLFLIHGSYSTLDYEDNISDLDTLILINDDTMLNSKKLLSLQEVIFSSFDYFYEIDLLQHHGYFVLTNFDLSYYNETFFPIMLFDYSTSIYQSKETFEVKLRDNSQEVKNILDSTLNYIEKTNPNSFSNLMGYKVYFQVIQLIPIAYLQYIGKNTYKKYSFELFLKDFPQYSEFFNFIYELRLNWKQNSIDEYNLLKFIFPKRSIFFLNSKMEKVPKELKKKLGAEQHKNILIPLVNDIRKKLDIGDEIIENI